MKIHFKVFVFACLFSFFSSAIAISCADYCKQNGWSDFSGLGYAMNWWGAASGLGHARGHVPRVGAVLVWNNWSGNDAGHVALVTSIVSNDEVLVNHANWAPSGSADGNVYTGVHVKDLDEFKN
ncbi:MAG: CHAP domain-containing protein [Candidatus Moraniibacteriota bacterium]